MCGHGVRIQTSDTSPRSLLRARTLFFARTHLVWLLSTPHSADTPQPVGALDQA